MLHIEGFFFYVPILLNGSISDFVQFGQTPEPLLDQPSVGQELKIILESSISTDSFHLSLVPKEAAGACIWHIPSNHCCHREFT